MSWFDLGALVLTLLAAVDGATSGLAWAAMETAVLLGSAAAARALAPGAEPYVFKATDLPAHDLPWVTHVVVFAVCAGSMFGLLLLAHPAAKKWRFRRDAWAGGALGVVNGALASLLIFAVTIGTTHGAWEEEAHRSRMLPVVASLTATPVAAVLPPYAPARAAALSEPR